MVFHVYCLLHVPDTSRFLLFLSSLVTKRLNFFNVCMCIFSFFNLLLFTFIYLFVCIGSYLQHMGLVAAAQGLSCPKACGILVSGLGIKPTSPALEDEFLSTGPLGKSPRFFHFYTGFKGCFPLIVITTYWLYSPCCTIHL